MTPDGADRSGWAWEDSVGIKSDWGWGRGMRLAKRGLGDVLVLRGGGARMGDGRGRGVQGGSSE